MKLYWFGTMRIPGHFFWTPPGDAHADIDQCLSLPWEYVDAIFPPRQDGGAECQQGQCTLIEKNDWTLVAFWDRTHDKRAGCNSALIAEGQWDFDEMVSMFREAFPKRMAELAFELDCIT